MVREEEEPLEAAEALEILAQDAHPREAAEFYADAIRVLKNAAIVEEIPRLICRQGESLAKAGRMIEGETCYKDAIELAKKMFGEFDVRTAQIYLAFGRFLQTQKRKNEAKKCYALVLCTCPSRSRTDELPDAGCALQTSESVA